MKQKYSRHELELINSTMLCRKSESREILKHRSIGQKKSQTSKINGWSLWVGPSKKSFYC